MDTLASRLTIALCCTEYVLYRASDIPCEPCNLAENTFATFPSAAASRPGGGVSARVEPGFASSGKLDPSSTDIWYLLGMQCEGGGEEAIVGRGPRMQDT